MASSYELFIGPRPASGTFPLTVDATGRHLETAGGDPFYMVGDSPYGLFQNLAPTDQETDTDLGAYLSARQAQGFNTVKTVAVGNNQTGGRSDGSTYDDIVPWLSTVDGTHYDILDPNETYWARVDAMVQLVTDYGFLLVLHHLDTQSWLSTMLANGAAATEEYGEWIGARYASFENIIWLSGNDYQDPSPTNDAVVIPAAQGIRTADPAALQSVQLFYLNSDSFDESSPSNRWPPEIDINSVYSYNHQYTYFRIAYNRSGPMPAYLVEASFEHEHNGGTDPSTEVLLRAQMYWGLTNGLTGHFYGEQRIWPQTVGSGWEDYLGPPNSPGVAHVTVFIDFVATIAWHTLVPDQDNEFLTSGEGTDGELDYATAALSGDGTLGLVYMPFDTDVTLDLSLMAGAVTGTWVDPTDGTTSTAGSGLTGSHEFTHPGNNGDGWPDWVLLLEAT